MALTPIGTTSYTLCGPPRWSIDSDGFDSVTLAYRGRYDLLQAFIASHSKYESCPLDGNLFLDNISSDDGKVQPTVDLRYKGCRGTLPAAKADKARNVQSASYSSAGGAISIHLTYYSRSISKTRIARNDSTFETPGTPDDITADDLIDVYVIHQDTADELDNYAGDPLYYFAQKTITTERSSEDIPGRYFRNTATTEKVLFPQS